VTLSQPLLLHVPAPGLLGHFTYIDPFAIWSAVILGMGLAAAAQITRKRAFAAVAFCFVLLQLLTVGGMPK
jgi:hypothetical protein